MRKFRPKAIFAVRRLYGQRAEKWLPGSFRNKRRFEHLFVGFNPRLTLKGKLQSSFA